MKTTDEAVRAPHAPATDANRGATGAAKPRLSVGLAQSKDVIFEAKRLRWRVFAQEMGARLPSRTPGVDHDVFDPFCEHLVVRNDDTGEVVGNYRILTPESARIVGCYYSETEFDLTRLVHLRPQLVEIGRSCVHPDYRSGAVITLLWSGLARFMAERAYSHLIGCASIGMADGGLAAARIYDALGEQMAPPEYRVFPRCPLPIDSLLEAAQAEGSPPPPMPPLIKGYLRAGAWICGAPAWDPDFNTADLPILLPIDRINSRHARHFFGRDSN